MAESALNLNYIVRRRKSLGFTQGKMAEKLGLNNAPAYNKYEKGIYKFKADMLPLLVKTLEAVFTEIIFRTVTTFLKNSKVA